LAHPDLFVALVAASVGSGGLGAFIPKEEAMKSLKQSNLAKIKIAQKQLGMDDSTYREFLARTVGQTSAAHLTLTEQYTVLAELERLGFRPTKPKKGFKMYAHATSRKLVMQWRELYRLGHVANQSDAALCQWIKAQTGKASPDWLEPTEARRLIEALKAWIDRPVGKGGNDGD
jgi:phage gp16-like protein